MDYIEAGSLSFSELNETIRSAGTKCRVSACLGQRFIAAGMSRKSIEIDGIPGNALGAYLNGADITVHGNAQDAVGDTMSAGRIYDRVEKKFYVRVLFTSFTKVICRVERGEPSDLKKELLSDLDDGWDDDSGEELGDTGEES